MKHAATSIWTMATVLPLAALQPWASAATVVWLGAGTDSFWSTAANWSGGVPPGDGDDVVLGASPSFASVVDGSVALGSFTYASNASATDLHVGGGAPVTLTFTGAGIVNDSASVVRQSVYADAGSGPVGATLVFANAASIVGDAPTTLTAPGASLAGGAGGTIVFQDHASTDANRHHNGVVAEGATVAGAGGGLVILRDDAHAQDLTVLVVRGGQGAGAAGGQMTVQDRARVDSNLTVLDGGTGGLGGRLDVRGAATFSGGLLDLSGGSNALAGSAAVARFFESATFASFAQLLPGQGNGFAGARLEFHDQSVFAGTADTAQIVNLGSAVGNAAGGQTLFFADTSIVGTHAVIQNATEAESMVPGSIGGSTEFHDRANAGQVQIYNSGAHVAGTGTLGGRTLFFDSASAGSATIENLGGSGAGAPGGQTIFSGNATAGRATILAEGGNPLGTPGGGGQIVFQGNANGGTATIGLDRNGTLDITASTRPVVNVGALIGTSGIVNLGSRTLAVGGDNASHDFYGALQGSGGSFIKEGAGDLIYGGTGTYTGTTSVNAGRLGLFNGTLASPVIAVASGATFGGVGTASGRVDLAAGATLSLGFVNGPSVLSLGALTSVAGSQFNVLLGAAGVVGGPKNDLLNVSGNLTLAGTLNVTDSGGFGLGAYRLINYGGALTYGGLALGTLPSGYAASDFTVQAGAGQVNLVVGGTSVQFWNGAATVADGVLHGGTGTWNNAATNWTDAGGVTSAAWGGRFAVFGGTAGTVTVAEPVAVTGLQFSSNGDTLNASGGGAIVLSGATTVRTDPGTTTTINAPLAGSGSLAKLDTGKLVLGGNSSYSGGTMVQDGTVVVTNAAGLGLGTGPVSVAATLTSVLAFVNGASAGGVAITNLGAPGSSFLSITEFDGSATAGTARFANQGNTAAGGFGGEVAFHDATTAGSAAFSNQGSFFAPPTGFNGNFGAGHAYFDSTSTAGTASFVNGASLSAAGIGGRVFFSEGASAGASAIRNDGAGVAGGVGGLTVFQERAGAGSATITNAGATVAAGSGGFTLFADAASAGSATIASEGGMTTGAAGGLLRFQDNATAAGATLLASGGVTGGGAGTIVFADNAAGGTARVVLNGGVLDISGVSSSGVTIGSLEGAGGNVLLGGKLLSVGIAGTDTSFAGAIGGNGILIKAGTGSLTLSGASSYTGGTSIADGLLIVTNAAGLGLGTGPVTNNPTPTSELRFSGNGSAGSLAISNLGSSNITYGVAAFHDSATAATATLTNQASSGSGGHGGESAFADVATAGNATIVNAGSAFAGASGAGSTVFSGGASAGRATFLNIGAASVTGVGGAIAFDDLASAATSTITNRGGQGVGLAGGVTYFGGNASADRSTIETLGGAVAGAPGGFTFFESGSTAAAATLVAGAAPVGAAGGSIVFEDSSSGGSARAIVQGGAGLSPGGLDISALSAPGMTIGSIEGGGVVSLGGKRLTVGLDGANTTFSGLVRDGGFVNATGGGLDVQGAGSLRLTGANTYTGATHVGNGVDANSGKLIVANATGSATGTGPVFVDLGGTLSGTGRIAGPVTLHAGGVIAPGDPSTLTFEDNLTWDGGGVIRLVLGNDQADSDLVVVLGHLIRGSGGSGAFRFDLIDAGFVPGQSYELVRAGALDGFSATDFTVSGIAGDLGFVDGALDFNAVAAPVPEPVTASLMLCGLAALATVLRGRRPSRGGLGRRECARSASRLPGRLLRPLRPEPARR